MYLDESGDYKDEEGKAIDVVIDKDLTEGESSGGSWTYTSIATNEYDTTLANALTATADNRIFTTNEYNEKLANLMTSHSNCYISLLISESLTTDYTDSNGEPILYKIVSYTGSVLTLESSVTYTGQIYGYRAYWQTNSGINIEDATILDGLTDKGITPKTSYVYLSVMNGTTTLIDKKKILTYTTDKKLAIEGGVSILLSDSDLNSLTYTAYNYISNTYTELGKTGDGKIIASDPTGGTVSGPVKYRWGPKNGSGKEESDYIWMPDSQAVKQTNMA